ncbi:MAG: methyltransferase domain-containing protein [Methylococcaceae bacterium]
MFIDETRFCPLCGGKPKGFDFPFATEFNTKYFYYFKCAKCGSVFVNPLPDTDTFSKMYVKSQYHDKHYEGKDSGAYVEYIESARLLRQYLNQGSLVLDYGCGTGGFLNALKSEGFIPYGVEFDKDAAIFASQQAECEALSVDEFFALSDKPNFDAIHLGDVLEHLPYPDDTLKQLLSYLRPNGILFVEGPLEINPSPVFWAAYMFGAIKHIFKPNFISNHPPTHLFRTGSRQQFDFFKNISPELELEYSCVYETGWPYLHGGMLKHVIANIAIILGGFSIGNITFGNRFKAIYTKRI